MYESEIEVDALLDAYGFCMAHSGRYELIG